MSVREKYNRISRFYEFLKTGDTRRWEKSQREFFQKLRGKVLYIGIGPGPEIANFPPGLEIVAIDLSEKMMAQSQRRAEAYSGNIRLANMNVEDLGFADGVFDCVLAVCVFCTVEAPVKGLQEVRRVLKPSGKLLMFEHVLSQNPVYALILKGMNLVTKRLSGTYLDRNTAANVEKAGFWIESNRNVYLDIVKTIEANP